MIDYNVLSTGSHGNAVVVGRYVLVDCGVPYKLIEPYINQLKLVLLTHIHGDHFNPATLRRIAAERPLMRFGACKWLIKPLIDAGVSPRQIDVYEPDYSYSYGLVNVIPFSLVHDVPNCGYKLHFPGGKAIYATDTGNLDGVEAKDYDLYLIEGNYEEAELEERILEKTVNGQYAYEIRVKKTHLSREQCDDFVARNIGSNGVYMYIHKHIDKTGGQYDRQSEGHDQEP